MQDDRSIDVTRGRISDIDSPILPSREPVFEQLTHAWMSRQISDAILTGASGAGKSWLWRKAAAKAREQHDDLRWVCVPHLPGTAGTELLHGILIALEEAESRRSLSVERVLNRIEKRVRELDKDGFHLELVVEESHHLGREGFEVIRILRERLRLRGIETGVLFVGQTSLIHHFHRISRDPSPQGWHLSHVTMPETLQLLRWISGPDHHWTRAEADWIHREALGNPRRILKWSRTLQPKPAETEKSIEMPGHSPEPSGLSRPSTDSSMWAEPLIPTRPPLNESEGVIEVGYEADFEDAVSAAPSIETSGRADPTDEESDPLEEYSDTSGSHRYRFESGETFAPYGLGVPRPERMPDSEL